MADKPARLPAYGVRVDEFGALGDGTTDDAPALQQALDAHRGLVVVPKGEYRIGSTLRISSGTRLVAHPEARFVLADGAGVGRGSHLLANANQAVGDRSIHVSGGVWDGNAAGNPRGADEPEAYTGVLFNFTNVEGLELRDMALRNPTSYNIRVGQARRFAISGIRFEADAIMPNQDGVHLGGFCEDGLIQDITATGRATPNDDLVALNADDANHRAQNLGKRCGPIRRVHVRRLRAEDCHSFVRFLSVDSPIEDVVVEDVQGGCRVCAINADACRSCMVPVMDASDPRYAKGCGDIRNCTATGMQVHKSVASNAKPLFDLQSHARGFELRDVVRDGEADMSPQAPTVRVAYVPGTEVMLEGITEKQLADARRAAPTSIQGEMRLAQLADTAAFRVEAKLSGMEDTLVLPGGGFSRLRLSR